MSDEQLRKVQLQFGATAAAYVTSAGHAGGDDLETLVAWARLLRPARVLDVATGGGHTALAVAGVARHVVAFDLTEPMLHTARAFLQQRGAHSVAFVGGDIEAPPFRTGAFDVVTCRIAPHHFPDLSKAVREIARLLGAGGSFLLQDILGHDDPDAHAFITEVERRRDPSHVRAYRSSEWTSVLQGAGLAVVEQATVRKVRDWADWTGRMRMPAEALHDLERFVRGAAPSRRAAFDFSLDGDRIVSFTDRMILVRADKV